jgi:pimeloyl-ACP methyl ester carboxylesterase
MSHSSTAAQPEAQFVTSRDGTRIGYRRLGAGPPVVVLHGALGSWQSWLAVAERLADRLEFLLVDRRGRGASGAGTPPHSLAAEVDDARAVLAAAGEGAAVVGHSFGGAVALELARTARPDQITRLVLYEPGVRVSGLIPARQVERMDELIERDRPKQALELAMVQLDAAGLVRAAGATAPDTLREIAWTLPREIRAVDALGSDLARYATIALPTLLLVGRSSPRRQQDNCEALARALPHARLVPLDGLGHVAHNADPDRAAVIVGSFLT